MNLKVNKINLFKIFALVILIIAPWANADFTDSISAGVPIQEDMSFYEINPCKVSLIEFIMKVPSSIYQDHYFFRFNDYSPIECFGRVSGATLVDNGFYISIGTNSFVNLVLQTFFWLILFSLIKQDDKKLITRNIYSYFSVFCSVSLIAFAVISEARFYEKSLFVFDLSTIRSKLYIFSFLILIMTLTLYVLHPRINSLFNFLPLIFLLTTVYSGFNFSLYLCIFLFFGFYFLVSNLNLLLKNKKYLLILVFPTMWALSPTERYSFKTDKLRGFTNSSFDNFPNIAWFLIFLVTILGIFYLFNKAYLYLSFVKIFNCFNVTTFILLSLSFIGANFPLINFFNYYYLGSQKYGVKIKNPFSFDVYGEKLAWRGLFSSSESIGEIYALFLVLTIFLYFSNFDFHKLYYLGIISSVFGLYFSNNRAALLLLLFIFIYLLFHKNKINRKLIAPTLTIFIFIFAWQVGFNNFTYSFDFMGQYTFSKASEFVVVGESSTFFNLVNNAYIENTLFKYPMYFLSIIAFFLNRSIMWGLFITRYNPSTLDLIFGTGPLSFGRYFNEIEIENINSLLLPHSSIISYLIFIGLGGLILISLQFYSLLQKKDKKLNPYETSIILFILLNIAKSDSLLYLNMIVIYSFLIYLVLFCNVNKFFNIK